MKTTEQKLAEIEHAISDYYFDLDIRQHGGVAQDRAFRRIEGVMGMEWRRGEELERRSIH